MKQLTMTEKLYDYMIDVSLREHPVLTALREETSHMELAAMQVSPIQAQFMSWLLKTKKAKRVLEIGTFTGYSALAMALALPDDGKLITCDINSEWTHTAEIYWEKAHQSHKIDLRLAPALETITGLINDNEHFDFIFIDADKSNYVQYYEQALKLIKPDGIIAIDNIFWDGTVVDEHDKGQQVREIRRLNQIIKEDKRVDTSLLPLADGLFLITLQ